MMNPYAVLAGGLPAICQGHIAAERSRLAQRLAEPGHYARVQGLERSVDVVRYPIKGKPLISYLKSNGREACGNNRRPPQGDRTEHKRVA
jgi:hypothetical protein